MVSLSLCLFPSLLVFFEKKRRSCTFWGDVNEMNKLMVGMFVERSIVLFCFRSKPAVHHRSSNCLTRWNLFPRKTNTILWELYVFFFWIYRCIDWIFFFFFFLKKKKKKNSWKLFRSGWQLTRDVTGIVNFWYGQQLCRSSVLLFPLIKKSSRSSISSSFGALKNKTKSKRTIRNSTAFGDGLTGRGLDCRLRCHLCVV